MNRLWTSRRARAGFTLIELLVVIAIIAILAAILFPVFAQARRKARQAACISNCKQIGAAVMMYLQDYDEVFPKTGGGEPVPAMSGFGRLVDMGPAANWPVYFAPYIKSAAVFICPESPVDESIFRGDVDRNGDGSVTSADDWGINDTMGYNYDGLTQDVNNPPRHLSELQEPAQTFVIFDNGDSTQCAGSNNWNVFLENFDLDWARLTNAQPLRHQKLASMVYADGHAKAIGYRELLTRKADEVAPWMTKWTDCNPLCKEPVFGPGGDFDPSRLP
jgi:prepilin-type N-terminal cleavage/methylation domain-containing protein/prepilin-type processing-associated H-X9-DG protein